MESNALKGKAALITGAASGLGEATARAFAQAGCAVACVDVNGQAAEATCRDLGAACDRSRPTYSSTCRAKASLVFPVRYTVREGKSTDDRPVVR